MVSFNVAQSQPDSRDLYWHQCNDRNLYYKRFRQIRPANAMVVTSINLINVCQHTDNESTG